MRIGKELFDLVKSLTPGENFIIRQELPPKKAAMYDVFRSMAEYDAKVVKAAFSGLSDQNLSTTQHQLIDMILKIVWNIIPKHGMRDLVQCIGEVEILIKKSLYQLAAMKVKEAIRLALGLEAGHELLLAIRLKQDIQELLNVKDDDPSATVALTQWAIKGMEERNPIEDWFSRVNALRNLPLAERKTEIDQLEQAIANSPYPATRRNQMRYHRCRHILAYMTAKHNVCMEESARIVEIADGGPQLMGDVQLRADYFTSIHFLIAFSIEQGAFDTAEKNIKKMEQAAAKWTNGISGDPALQGRHTHATLYLLLYKKDWEGAKKRARQVLKEMTIPGGGLVLRHRPAWLHMTLLAAFLSKDFGIVRKFAAELKDSLTGTIVSDSFISGIGLYYLAALFEEQDEFLETATRLTQKWYVANQCLGPFEVRMIRFFLQLSKVPTSGGQKTLLIELKQDLELLFKEPLFWKRREVFPVIKWLDSLLNGVDLRDLVITKRF